MRLLKTTALRIDVKYPLHSALKSFLSLVFVFQTGFLHADLLWPIDRPQRISGAFCEPRGIRFHYGLDVSCAGRKGFKVFSADEGFVSTVMYQKWGIGYAVFITHRNGNRSLYGHLDRFSDPILQSIQIKKYAPSILDRTDFRVELKKGDLPVSRGEVIGYSGDSGIGKEHFHFELRDSGNRNLNPLTGGLRVRDTRAPVFTELFLVPLDGCSTAGGERIFTSIKLKSDKKTPDVYTPSGGSLPPMGGKIGLKIKLHDFAGYTRRVSVYRIALFIDDRLYYELRFDSADRSRAAEMGLVYDYDNTSNSVYTYYLYSKTDLRGAIDTSRLNKESLLRIEAMDASGNKAIFSARLNIVPPREQNHLSIEPNLRRGKSLRMQSQDGRFSLRFEKSSAFYDEAIDLKSDTLPFARMSGLEVKSDCYSISPTDLCIQKPAEVSLRYDADDHNKVGLYFLGKSKRSFYFIGNSYDTRKKCISAASFRMGRFFLLKDEIPPRILYRKPRRINPGHIFRFRVSDLGSGIDVRNIQCAVDDRPAKWDFDPDNSVVEILPHNDIWKKGAHRGRVRVCDRSGNATELNFGYSL